MPNHSSTESDFFKEFGIAYFWRQVILDLDAYFPSKKSKFIGVIQVLSDSNFPRRFENAVMFNKERVDSAVSGFC